MRAAVIVVIALSAVTSCSLPEMAPLRIVSEAPEALAKERSDDLCAAYENLSNTPRRQAILEELQKRHVLRDEYMSQINSKKVAIRMSPIETMCAWGLPNKVNSTISASGSFVQWVYQLGGLSAQYVYFSNDVVSSIQSS